MSFPVSSLRIFIAIFLGDLIVRTAYLTGKSPLLPVFADQLGADAILLGLIVSISAVTGLICKPIIGFLNDRMGAWIWICFGTAIFVTMPWAYGWVETPADLVKVRLIHGMATAIYGPVTLALLAGLFIENRAQVFGWFGIARTGAGMAGPLLGGILLTLYTPATIYAITGAIAALSLIPLTYLRLCTNAFERAAPSKGAPIGKAAREAFKTVGSNKHLLIFATVELNLYLGIYMLKAFFPILLLANGRSFLEVGLFLTVQEAVSALLRPATGYLADHWGYRPMIALGLIAVGFGMALVPHLLATPYDISVAVLVGLGHAAFVPAFMALVAHTIDSNHRGAAFGLLGATRNAGKIIGPVGGGVLIATIGHASSFYVLAAVPLVAAALVLGRQGAKWIGNAIRIDIPS